MCRTCENNNSSRCSQSHQPPISLKRSTDPPPLDHHRSGALVHVMIHPPRSEGEGPHKHQTFTYETYEVPGKEGIKNLITVCSNKISSCHHPPFILWYVGDLYQPVLWNSYHENKKTILKVVALPMDMVVNRYVA